MANSSEGLNALLQLTSTEPPQWLTQSPDLSKTVRKGLQHLYSSLQPFCPKSPIDRLIVEGFDAEQIWQQIDLQTQPLVSTLKRDVKKLEKNPEEIRKAFDVKKKKKSMEEESEGDEEGESGKEDDLEDFEGMEDEEDVGFDDEEGDEDEDEDDEEEEEEEGGTGNGEIGDKFFNPQELEKYLADEEEREYGGGGEKKKKKKEKRVEEEDEEDEDEDDEDELEDEMGVFNDGSEDEEEEMETARYEDFFGGKNKKSVKRVSKPHDVSENLGTDDDQDFDDKQKKENLSTHEKQQEKQRSKIEEMEKLNMEPKSWTMQGEVNAAKRPKNSALAVDLDFEHNVRPPPVITEEVTASLEEIIKKRILEGNFDDVQKAPTLPSKAPKALKELDENKSKKGLAELYADDYVQTAGLASAPLSSSDELRQEASMLLKTICLKLDALSHFHFTPKPIIEDMKVQTNVPALAMEEIAPVAVSDEKMLAPEEVFAGKGDIKEEAELTQEEKKRRRANKKRKFKAETARREEKRSRSNKAVIHSNGKEEA